MVKQVLILVLLSFLLAACNCPSDKPANTIESEFRSYFNEPFQQTLGHAQVQLVTAKRHMAHHSIPVKIVLKVDEAEKVLLLKLQNTGYYKNGLFSQECADDPVKIAAFTLAPTVKLKELETRFNTQCLDHTLTLLVWVKTQSGDYYSTSTTLRTVYESPG